MHKNTKLNSSEWATEISPDVTSAFSIKIKKKLHEEQTPFQHMAVYETVDFGNLLMIDGVIQLTSRDIFVYHEMMSHPALFTHPNPLKVAIIGGGDCGVLHEVLKHKNLETVIQVDIDEAVTKIAEKYFPEFCQSNQDPRATLLFADALNWIKNESEDSWDIMIIDSTDGFGPAEELFGENFYKQCHRVLRKNGIIIHQSGSPVYHFKHTMKHVKNSMQRAGFHFTKALVFPVVGYPSGWWSATMASPDLKLTEFNVQNAKNKDFLTEYYNEAIHQAALAEPEFMK